ncbi:hypothetical protein ENSA5_49940 [Enhygromyxa salina]|uniref:Uncharacterized protein n=1 Tax=Enhygromyxa salina TaxID=215803 RepID=A0A2S9XHM2_9BACT|nr:hypothetical protein [Enhygromyxa salina]PRP92363.1 hypothetical protein ENSA5_49940 [Enhygromyxa salina]
MALFVANLLLAGTISAPPSEAPPGGYWTMGEQREREREPADGDDELTIGSVLFSLGLLRAGAAALSLWMAGRPDLCPISADADCSSLRTYGFVGIGEGSLMIGTGIVYLAIGASRRQRHQRWQRGEVTQLRHPPLTRRLQLGPWLTPSPAGWAWGEGAVATPRSLTGGGVRVRVRF